MTQTQNFIIKKIGLVRGGTASYTFNEEYRTIKYSASINIGINWFISKTYEKSGIYVVNPDDLLSIQFQKRGDSITVGPVTFTALRVDPAICVLSITIEGQDITGTVTMDKTHMYMSVLGADATIMGMTVSVVPDTSKTSLFRRLSSAIFHTSI